MQVQIKKCISEVVSKTNKASKVVVSKTKQAGVFAASMATASVTAVAEVLAGLLKVLWRLVTLPVDILFGFIMLVMMAWMSHSMRNYSQPQYIKCVNI